MSVDDVQSLMTSCSFCSSGGPYLKVYLQHSDASSRTVEPHGKLVANISAHTVGVGGEPSANVSSDKTEVNGVGCANVSGASRVDVDEGQNMKLTFVMEAYPPISFQRWTSTHINTAHQARYSVNNYRSVSLLIITLALSITLSIIIIVVVIVVIIIVFVISIISSSSVSIVVIIIKTTTAFIC